ncbi:Pentatricopeptide repeat-containing protein [Acorus gramineus]|uniref:Pentatricopeptide repeat-containing protein n=1 Tax=Acorus gramineus TaxID=55184 RepID=A0AAV9A4S7_ACOGR|nr:Pentatricopeptide repeat-containing protein [Acorus gramineus]
MFAKLNLPHSLTSLQNLSKPDHHLLFFSSFSTLKHTTPLTKSPCISLIQTCKSMKHLKQIHCQLFKASLHLNKDVLNKLLAFSTDPKTGDIKHAEKMFENLRNPSLFMYNLMIRAFTKKGSFDKTFSLFRRLREDQFSPDNFTYPFVLKAIGCLREVAEAEKIRGLVIKTGFEFDSFVRNSLVDMYAEMGLLGISRGLFTETPKRDVIAWNVMINGCVKCGKYEDALSIFKAMEEEGVGPDEGTLVSILSTCAALGNLEVGMRIHSHVTEELKCSTILGNALIDMYSKCGSLEAARRCFKSMRSKNTISWTTMVSGYANRGRLEEAWELFKRSPSRDVVSWTAMINGYIQFSHFDEALSLFREMQLQHIKPDRFTVVSLLTACAHLGALEQGKWIHRYIKDNRIRIDCFVGTALVDMYAKCGYVEKSIEVFDQIERRDTASWTSIICGLALNGHTFKALNLFREMERVGTKPDDITFIGVLSACVHGGLVNEGRRCFYAMKETYKIEPKVEHYGCLVNLLARAGLFKEAEELITSVPSDENVMPLWGSLLGACRIHGDVSASERVAKQVLKSETRNSGTYALLANIYAAADQWEEVNKVRRKMKEIGVKKPPGCSSVEVDGVVYEFLIGDSSHPQTQEIYSMLMEVTRMMDREESDYDIWIA